MSTLRSLAVAALLAGLAAPAFAQNVGTNLRWEACGPAAAAWRCAACNSNTGAITMVGSFVPPAGVTQLYGMEITIDVQASSPTLPDWWQFVNAGSCRQNSLGLISTPIEADSACVDYWSGQAVGGISSYRTFTSPNPMPNPNQARILGVLAVPLSLAGPVDNGTEYFAFRLRINYVKTVGTGSCAGCETPVFISMPLLKLVQPVGVGDFFLSNPAYDTNYLGWQMGQYNTPCIVPAQSKTWGGIKAIYR